MSHLRTSSFTDPLVLLSGGLTPHPHKGHQRPNTPPHSSWPAHMYTGVPTPPVTATKPPRQRQRQPAHAVRGGRGPCRRHLMSSLGHLPVWNSRSLEVSTASPRSQIFTCSPSSSRMLAGLRSLPVAFETCHVTWCDETRMWPVT
jgi:hypothetical protein